MEHEHAILLETIARQQNYTNQLLTELVEQTKKKPTKPRKGIKEEKEEQDEEETKIVSR